MMVSEWFDFSSGGTGASQNKHKSGATPLKTCITDVLYICQFVRVRNVLFQMFYLGIQIGMTAKILTRMEEKVKSTDSLSIIEKYF